MLSAPLLRHCRSPLPHTVPTGGLDPPLAPSPAPLGCSRAGLCSVWREALSSARGWAPTVRPCGEEQGESLVAAPGGAERAPGGGCQGSPLLVPPPSRSLGLVGVVCPGPSWLVPSCSFRMCLTTAVALKACCRPHRVRHPAQGAWGGPLHPPPPRHSLHPPVTPCSPSTCSWQSSS